MTDDDTRARFEEITSGDELADLRNVSAKPRRQWMHRAAFVVAWLLVASGVVWALVYVVAWIGHHDMLPAPH